MFSRNGHTGENAKPACFLFFYLLSISQTTDGSYLHKNRSAYTPEHTHTPFVKLYVMLSSQLSSSHSQTSYHIRYAGLNKARWLSFLFPSHCEANRYARSDGLQIEGHRPSPVNVLISTLPFLVLTNECQEGKINKTKRDGADTER